MLERGGGDKERGLVGPLLNIMDLIMVWCYWKKMCCALEEEGGGVKVKCKMVGGGGLYY